jgi:hypothetical protein
VTEGDGVDIVYFTMDDFYRAAAQALGTAVEC